MAYIDSSFFAPPINIGSGSAQVAGGVGGGAPTGSGPMTSAQPTSSQPGANGPGTNISPAHWLIVLILLDSAFIIGMGYLFRGRNL